MAETARPSQTPLTTAVTTSQGGFLLPGQAKTDPMLNPQQLQMCWMDAAARGQGNSHTVLRRAITKYCKCIRSRCLCWAYLAPQPLNKEPAASCCVLASRPVLY